MRMTLFGAGRMLSIVIAGAALLLSGCGVSQAAEVEDCERRLINGVAAPSTYKRISVESNDLSKVGPKHQAVTIKYDISNDKGVPVRQTAMCRYLFEGDTKKPDLSSVARVYPGREVAFEGRMRQMSSLPKDQQEPLLAQLHMIDQTARETRAKSAQWEIQRKQIEAGRTSQAQSGAAQGQSGEGR